MAKNNEIATLSSNESFLALQDFNFADVMAEEMNGLSASFERVKIPIGGGTVFEIPGDDSDDVDTVKEINAVILHHHPLNAYYATKYTGGSNPPDCGSYDGLAGVGNPGGSCKNCPYNVFGSGENGAKACKNRRRLYLLREGDIFPMILSLPTGFPQGIHPLFDAYPAQVQKLQRRGDPLHIEESHLRHRHRLLAGAVCRGEGAFAGGTRLDCRYDRAGKGHERSCWL